MTRLMRQSKDYYVTKSNSTGNKIRSTRQGEQGHSLYMVTSRQGHSLYMVNTNGNIKTRSLTVHG